MTRVSFFLFFCVILSTGAFSQRILAFDKSGKVKRIRYYEGEYITLQTTSKEKINGIISQIGDSTFSVEGTEINLVSVAKIYNSQTGMGYQLVANIFILPAIGYLPLITINSLINNENPVFRANQLYYGGGFIAIRLLANYLANRPFRISDKRPLKIIDTSI